MNTSLPTGPRGQVLAVGFAAALAATLWFGVASPLMDWHADRAGRLAQRREVARHMAQAAARLEDLKRQLAAAAQKGEPALAVLDGASDPIAGAALQGLVQDMADRSGVSVTSSETLPAEQVGAYRRIGLKVSVYAPHWPQLVQLLQAIETAAPRMLIDDLQIHGMPSRAQDKAPAIDASLIVFAFRAGAPSGDRG